MMNYLPQAIAEGTRIETDTEAIEVRPLVDPAKGPRDGPLTSLPLRWELSCRNRVDGSLVRFRARILILAGGTVGTAVLLLRSKDHLPDLSRHVGRNIAFNGSVKAAGILPDDFPEGDMFSGRSQPGVISYHFFDTHGITILPGKPLPLQLAAGAKLRLDGDTRVPADWGEAGVEIMKACRRRMIILDALGLTPPVASLRLVDGKPALSLPLTDGLRSYHDRIEALLRSILARNGCRLLNPTFIDREGAEREDIHFSTAHQTGSCRMADAKERGVVDAMGEVFDYPGLYVSDGAAVPTSLAVNTSLTILANAERIAAGLVERFMSNAAATR